MLVSGRWGGGSDECEGGDGGEGLLLGGGEEGFCWGRAPVGVGRVIS